jgi:integrase/recombinase XerD
VRFLEYLQARGIERVDQLTREVLLEYQASLFTTKTAKGRPLALGTQAQRLAVVLEFLQYLVRRQALLVSPGSGIELPRHVPKRPPRNVPTVAEVEALLNAPSRYSKLGIRDRAILELLYSTGVRVGELIRLKVYDVNLTAGQVQVIGGKGDKDRVVPLGKLACEAVGAYLKEVRTRIRGAGPTGTLFLSSRGKPLHRSRVRGIVHQYCRKAELDRVFSTHALRHACATHMLKNGASIRHVQEQLGHESLATTQIYTHLDIEDLKAVHQRTHPRENRGESGS